MESYIKPLPNADVSRAARLLLLMTQAESEGLNIQIPPNRAELAPLVLVGVQIVVTPTTYGGFAAYAATGGRVPLDVLDLSLTWDTEQAISARIDPQGTAIPLNGFLDASSFDISVRLLEAKVPASAANLRVQARSRFASGGASNLPTDLLVTVIPLFRRELAA